MRNKKNNPSAGDPIGRLGERRFLRRLLPAITAQARPRFLVPPGDDSAVMKRPPRTVLSIDGLTEGTHFKLSWATTLQKRFHLSMGRVLGWKLMGRALSDLAAMGTVRHRWALIYLGGPASLRVEFLWNLYKGVSEAARRYDCVVAGGDTVRAKDLTLAAAVGGQIIGRPLIRRGASPAKRSAWRARWATQRRASIS